MRGETAVHPETVRQCEFSWEPTIKPGSRLPDWRRCTFGVVAPASFCHKHGGAVETSLAMSFKEAAEAASHGKLFLPAAEHWKSPRPRMERAQGRGWAIFAANPVAWARLWVAAPRGHLRVGDQLATFSHYLDDSLQLEGPALEEAVYGRAAEPHLPPRRWYALGRAPADDSGGVFSSRKVLLAPVEFDPTWTARESWGWLAMNAAGESVPYHLYGWSDTEGPLVDATKLSPGASNASVRTGLDTEAALEEFTAVAGSRGWRLVFGIHRPNTGVATFERHDHVAQVYGGLPDRMTRLHAVAHVAGHIVLGHTACGDDRRVPEEPAAEAWAFMALARLGLLSARGADAWRSTYTVDLRTGSYPSLRAAAAALAWTLPG